MTIETTLTAVAFRKLGSDSNRFAIDHLENLVRSPDDVRHLEQAILALAVTGKLVPGVDSDGTGADLLTQIESAKSELSSTARKTRRASGSRNYDLPFEIPSRWAWTTLSDAGAVNPRNEVEDSCEVSFFPMASISADFGVTPRREARTWREVKSGFTHLAENDVAVAKITPCFENSKAAVMSGLHNEFGAGTTELHVFRNTTGLVVPEFVYCWFKSTAFLESGASFMTGTAGQKRVPSDFVSRFPFPLPPHAEQVRIVERVQHFFAMTRELARVLGS